VNGPLGGLELGPRRCLGRFAQASFALCFGVLLLQALDVVGLPERLGPEAPEGGRKGLAVFSVALSCCGGGQ
jgi:hypothetical protein